jgi:hypothetical protein
MEDRDKYGGPLPMSGTPMTGPLHVAEPPIWPTDPNVIATLTLAKMNWLTLMPSGIRIDMETGEVVIPEGVSLSDAARAFWEAISRIARPGFW